MGSHSCGADPVLPVTHVSNADAVSFCGRFDCNYSLSLVRNSVYHYSAPYGSDVACGVKRCGQNKMQYAFFGEYRREIRIRSESVQRLFLKFIVVIHIFTAYLFITSENHSDLPGRLESRFFQGIYPEQRRIDRSLVVHGPAAPDLAVGDLCRIWLMGPAVTFRYHVQVTKCAYVILAFTVFSVTVVIIHIGYLKPEFFSYFQLLFQRLARAFSERHTLSGLSPYAFDSDHVLKGCDQFITMLIYDLIKLFIHFVLLLKKA